MARTVTRRVNVAGVGTLARRLMAIERARALGRKPVDARVLALQVEASRWERENANEVSGHRMSGVEDGYTRSNRTSISA